MQIRWVDINTGEKFEITEYSYYFAEKKLNEIRKNKNLAIIFWKKL